MIFKLLKYYISLFYWDYASIKSVKKMQLKKFRDLFEHAKKHSKFYQDLYTEHGVMDLKIKSWDDIEKVPIVTKSMLRQYSTRDIMTCDIDNKINIHSTSGSTGEPFKVAYTKYEDYSSHVRLTREMMKHGYTPFKKLALLSRYEPDHNFEIEEDLSLLNLIQAKFGIFKREVISIFEPVDDIILSIRNINPFVIWTTPSIIQIVALKLQEMNERLDVPLVLLMSETISKDQEKLFQDRVCKNYIDLYGCMESPFIGYSYNNINYKKIVCNSSFVEVLNHRRIVNQSVGDVVFTNLINKTMPFIRYDVGDFAGILDDKNFPNKKIGKIQGRFDDIFSFGNKETLTYHQSYQLFRDFHECEQYKFIQEKDHSITLQLKITSGSNREMVMRKAKFRWHEKYKHTDIKIEFVDCFKIDEKTGKFKVLEKKSK